MTHEELLAKIHKAYLKGHTGYMSNALCAVVELHKPHNNKCYQCEYWTNDGGDYQNYPCSTIQAIEKELK